MSDQTPNTTLIHPPPQPRFLIVSFPSFGHMNPALRLADRLIRHGCQVTFLTSAAGHRKLTSTELPSGVSVSTFSDNSDESTGGGSFRDFDSYNIQFRRHGSLAAREQLRSGLEEGRPYMCVLYTLLLSWVVDVAAEFSIPAVLVWIQAATLFDIQYFYFHGFEDSFRGSSSLKFPGLDQLDFSVEDLPKTSAFVEHFREQFDVLDKEIHGKVLVNTFDDLEPEALRASNISLIGIGPLFELNDHEDGDHSIQEWLDSKPKGSVVYVSFGSVANLSNPQLEEIAKGLLEFGRPFLWVIRNREEKLSCEEELEKLGAIVPWCSQVGVLRHEAVGCFVTHCGWNSTLESLVCGVPMVAFPQNVDQTTNAKLIEDFWKVGLRIKTGYDNNDIVGGDEMKRCLGLVMQGQEFSRQAMKWKDLAREATKEGGSSDVNLKAFVAEVIGIQQ